MKILAKEKEKRVPDPSLREDLLRREAFHVYQLYLAGPLREIYFSSQNQAVLIQECEDREEAERRLQTLPLVTEGYIHFELMELYPYTGYRRILDRSMEGESCRRPYLTHLSETGGLREERVK